MSEDRLQSVTLQKLRIFAAVADERSFVKAADVMFLSCPTISYEIKILEGMVGMKLLHRSRGRRDVALTEAGAILLETYNEIDKAMGRAGQALEAIKHLDNGTVFFATNVSFGHFILPAICNTFHQAHSSIRLRVDVSRNQNILYSLARRKVDLAVILDTKEVPGFICEALAPCFAVFAGPRGHRLAGTSAAPFSELAREELILGDRDTPFRRILERMAGDAAISLDPILEVSNSEACLQAALCHEGIVVVNTDSVILGSPLNSGKFCPLNIQGLPVEMHWFVVHLPDRLSPAAQSIKDYLLQSRSIIERLSYTPEPVSPSHRRHRE